MKQALCFFVAAVASVTAGCGEPVGCRFDDDDRCQERRGLQALPFAPACEGSGGEVVEGGCPEDGRVFGCAIDGGDDVVDFYYAPKTEEDAESECGSDEIVDVDF